MADEYVVPNITYDANGNILTIDGAPINSPYVPAGIQVTNPDGSLSPLPNLAVDYTDAKAVLDSPFANTAVFNNSDKSLDGLDDDTGLPSLFEDMLLQGADTRSGLDYGANNIIRPAAATPLTFAEQQARNANEQSIADATSGQNTFLESQGYVYDPITKSYGLPSQAAIDAQALKDAADAQALKDAADAQALKDAADQAAIDAINNPPSTAQEIADALTARGLGSSGNFFLQGSSSLDDIIARHGGDESFMDLVNRYDPSTMSEFEGNYNYNPYNQDFGAGSGRNQVYYLDPTTGQAAVGLASEVNALYPGIETFAGVNAFTAANSDPTLFDTRFNPNIGNTTVDNTTTNTDPNYEDLYNTLLSQQGQTTSQPSGQTDYSGLMGLLNQFMQSRNSLQGGGRYGNQYGSMYGGGMGYNSPYGNPFNSGMGYGYGMNPYSGGIGSFYGNTGLGYSPSGYNSGYGSGYGMNNMFYGGYGGNNYNQQQQMAYNPYSSLYSQLSNPQTYGYSGDVYTPEYNSYLNTQYEGDRYSSGYQDYLQTNNPGVYTNLFGGAV